MPVPIDGIALNPDLAQWLSSPQVQRLLSGRIDVLELVRSKSFCGRAFVSLTKPPVYGIRLSVLRDLPNWEWAVLLCHELAHHTAGVRNKHSDEWRKHHARLVRKAGKIGLLTPEQVEEAVDLALNAPVNADINWREGLAERERIKREHDGHHLGLLLANGLTVGSRVAFDNRGKPVSGTVKRINRRTVTVTQDDTPIVYRVPFRLVEFP